MDENDVGRSGRDPLTAMRERWFLCLLLVVVGVAGGVALSTRHQVATTAEARLAVGSSSLASYQVPGYAVAAEQLASNYARFVVDSPTVQPTVDEAVGDDAATITSLSASPIPDSNVVRVEVVGTDADAAVAAAQAVAEDLRDRTAPQDTTSPEDLLAEFRTLAAKANRAEAKASELEGRPAQLEKARAATLRIRMSVVGNQYQESVKEEPDDSSLRIIQDATVSGDDERQALQFYAVAGLLAGLLLGLVLANLLPPRRRGARRPARTAD